MSTFGSIRIFINYYKNDRQYEWMQKGAKHFTYNDVDYYYEMFSPRRGVILFTSSRNKDATELHKNELLEHLEALLIVDALSLGTNGRRIWDMEHL